MNYAWLGAEFWTRSGRSTLTEVALIISDEGFQWEPAHQFSVPIAQHSSEWLGDLEEVDPAKVVTYRRNGLAQLISSTGHLPRDAERVLCSILAPTLPARPVVASMDVWHAINSEMPALVRSLSDDVIDLSAVWEFAKAFVRPQPYVEHHRVKYRAMNDLSNVLAETKSLTEQFAEGP